MATPALKAINLETDLAVSVKCLNLETDVLEGVSDC